MTSVAYGLAFPASRGLLTPVRYLLDVLSAAPVAAYATWRLRHAYSGACLRVRRSSDNAEQDIGLLGDSLDVPSLLSFAGSASAFVTKLYSQATTAGCDLTQATATRQPKIVSAGALTVTSNGTVGMLFDGVDDALNAIFTLNQPLTRVSAARLVTYTNNSRLWDGWTVNRSGLFESGVSPQVSMFAGSSITDVTHMTVSVDHVITEQFNGASSNLAIDNNAYVTGNIGAAAAGGYTIGASDGNGSAAANIVFYGGILVPVASSAADIALCRSNFGARIGLAL